MECMDDFNPAPDDHIDAPIVSLCLGAARSQARLERLRRIGGEDAEWVAEREMRLIQARNTALRIRAHEAAEFITRTWGRDTVPGDLMDHGTRYCLAAYLWAIVQGAEP